MAAQFVGSGAAASTVSCFRADVAWRSRLAPTSTSLTPRPCAPLAAVAAWVKRRTEEKRKRKRFEVFICFPSPALKASSEGKKKMNSAKSFSTQFFFLYDACVTKRDLYASHTALRSFPSPSSFFRSKWSILPAELCSSDVKLKVSNDLCFIFFAFLPATDGRVTSLHFRQIRLRSAPKAPPRTVACAFGRGGGAFLYRAGRALLLFFAFSLRFSLASSELIFEKQRGLMGERWGFVVVVVLLAIVPSALPRPTKADRGPTGGLRALVMARRWCARAAGPVRPRRRSPADQGSRLQFVFFFSLGEAETNLL